MRKRNICISVVTVVFNDVENIERTMRSVFSQYLADFTIQYLVIDGGSTDGTVDKILQYRSRIDYFVSESDKGIYDAMNKGVKSSVGDWVVFLNSGDSFYKKNSLRDVVNNGLCCEVDLFATKVVYGRNRIFKPCRWDVSLKNNIHHQGALYNRKVFRERLFSLDYSILSDYEFNYWLFNSGRVISTMDVVLAFCNEGGVSQIPKWKNYKEEISIRRMYSGCSIYNFFTLLRYIFKRFYFTGK